MNSLVLTLAVIFLPGIIAVIICDKIAIHSKWSSFKFGLYAFVLGVLSYTSLQMFVYLIDVLISLYENIIHNDSQHNWTHLNVWNLTNEGQISIKAWEVCSATALSIPISLIASKSVNAKWFNKIARTLKVSTKYGDENLYSYYLNAEEIEWVYIRDIKNNLTYQGRIYQHSENDHIQEMVLLDVTVYRYEDSQELYELQSIYLSMTVGSFVIEAVPEYLLEISDEPKSSINRGSAKG